MNESGLNEKIEIARTIGFWLVVLMLVIMSYQMGMTQMTNTNRLIENKCGNYIINHSVGWDGTIALWKNPPTYINNLNVTVP